MAVVNNQNLLPKHNPKLNPNIKKSNAILLDANEIKDFTFNKDTYDLLIRAIRIQEEQEFISCFKWYGLPPDISSEFLERLIYYRGTLVFFYYKDNGKFMFMPYNYRGNLDYYGRVEELRAIPFYQSKEKNKDTEKEIKDPLTEYYLYNVKYIDFTGKADIEHSAVILNDYTPQFSLQSSITPRQQINETFIRKQADILSLLYTNLIAGSGVKGLRVGDDNAKNDAISLSKDIEQYAKLGIIYIPIRSATEFQELSSNTRGKCEEYLMSYQSIDNLRKSMFGLSNNGVYEKKTQMLQDELGQRMSEINTILKNRLAERQRFCLIANSIWGTNLWCEYSEEVINNDANGDGNMFDNDKQTETSNYYESDNNIGGGEND